MELNEFKSRLKFLRKQHQLTLVQLSDLTGISPSHLSALERGERLPSLQYAQKIADGLQIPFSELYTAPSPPLEDSDDQRDSVDYSLDQMSQQILEAYRAYEFPEDWRTKLLLAARSDTDPLLQLAWTFLRLQRENAPLSTWVQIFAEFLQGVEKRRKSPSFASSRTTGISDALETSPLTKKQELY